jgi:hypothetical protein
MTGLPHDFLVCALLPFLLCFGCGWEDEKTFTLPQGDPLPRVELRAWKSKQRGTHGNWGHTWYHAKSTLHLEGLSLQLELVSDMDAPTDAARRARGRSFLLEWSGDRRAAMVSVDEGAHWILAPIDAGSIPFVRDYMIPAAGLTHDSGPLFKRLVSAQLGSQTTGLPKSGTTRRAVQGHAFEREGHVTCKWSYGSVRNHSSRFSWRLH